MSGALDCTSISGIAWLHIQDVDDWRVVPPPPSELRKGGCCRRGGGRLLASTSVGFFSFSGFGLPACPGDNYHEVRGDLWPSVCVAALRKPATEGRGRPATQPGLEWAETPTSLCLSTAVINSDLIRLHRWTFPVVEVILQISISYTKLELLQEHFILHEIQSVEHIEPFLSKPNRTGKNHETANALRAPRRDEITSLARISASFIKSRRGVCVWTL